MSCLNCSHFHRSTALTAGTTLVITLTNSTNIADEDRFCFVLCQNPNTAVTGEPIPVQMNINGANVDVYNKYSKPLNSHTLARYYRKGVIRGYYAVSDKEGYVVFNEVPKCKCME